jgi:DNA-binding transcriptional LysR family regulator
MDTLTSLRVFTLVADLRSFSAAAERLHLSTAMVSKHVKHLERRVSARLLNRTSRSVSLSEAGERYLARVRATLDDLDEIEHEISDAAAVPQGALKVSIPVWLANDGFVRCVAVFQARHPKVRLDINVSGRMVNLVEEGFDLALRGTFSPDEGLVARRLADIAFLLVAAPSLLETRGRPTRIADIAGAPVLAYLPVMPEGRVTINSLGVDHELQFTPVLRSDNEQLLQMAAREGMGYMFAPRQFVEADLASGRLEAVLPDLIAPRAPLFAVYPHRRYLPAKVRAFLGVVADAFA